MNPLSTLLLLTLVTVTACASGKDPTRAGEPTPSLSSVAATGYMDVGDAPEHTELTPGVYALAAYDSATAPLFVLNVPEGLNASDVSQCCRVSEHPTATIDTGWATGPQRGLCQRMHGTRSGP